MFSVLGVCSTPHQPHTKHASRCFTAVPPHTHRVHTCKNCALLTCPTPQGWIEKSILDRTRALLQRANLPVTVPDVMTVEMFRSLMAVDKKVWCCRLLVLSLGRLSLNTVCLRCVHCPLLTQ